MNKGALERLQERIRTADRGWFFAAVADKVSERRQEVGLSQRELAELVGTTQRSAPVLLTVLVISAWKPFAIPDISTASANTTPAPTTAMRNWRDR